MEKQLVEKIIQSDQSAFKTIFEQYSKPIFQFLCRKLNNKDEAEDLVQEVFIRVWNSREKLDANKSFKSYLYTIANNIAIDYYRKNKKSMLNIEDYEYQCIYFEDGNFDIPNHIKKEINKLTPMQKNVFYLSRFEGLSNNEISEMLGLSKRTVENHISRALKKLKENLQYLLFIIFYFNH